MQKGKLDLEQNQQGSSLVSASPGVLTMNQFLEVPSSSTWRSLDRPCLFSLLFGRNCWMPADDLSLVNKINSSCHTMRVRSSFRYFHPSDPLVDSRYVLVLRATVGVVCAALVEWWGIQDGLSCPLLFCSVS